MASPLILYKIIDQNWVNYPRHVIMLERHLEYTEKYTDIAFKLCNLLTNIINIYVRSTLGVMLTNKTEAASAPSWMLEFVQHIYPSLDIEKINRQLYGILHTISMFQIIIDKRFSGERNEKLGNITQSDSLQVENKTLLDIYAVLLEAYSVKNGDSLDKVLSTYVKRNGLDKKPVVLYRLYLYNKSIKDFFSN